MAELYINGKVFNDYVDNIKIENFKLEELGYNKIPDNYYFVLGDNRNDSLDSREIGLIKKSDIVGKKIVKIWPVKN